VLPLISTIHKSPQHPLSLFQPAVSSPAFPWQQLLTVEILQLHTLRFDLHSLPWRTLVSTNNWLTPRLVAITHQPSSLLFTGFQLITVSSQSHIATDGQSVNKPWRRAASGANDQIFITVWHLQSCFCGAPSLTRGRVCLLYMLLAFASAVFLGSESTGTRNHILLSQIWDFPFCRLLQLYSPGHGGGIQPRLHTGYNWVTPIAFLITTLHGLSKKRRFQQ
jgi:hypothetical protein